VSESKGLPALSLPKLRDGERDGVRGSQRPLPSEEKQIPPPHPAVEAKEAEEARRHRNREIPPSPFGKGGARGIFLLVVPAIRPPPAAMAATRPSETAFTNVWAEAHT